jgi:hypothetical protein
LGDFTEGMYLLLRTLHRTRCQSLFNDVNAHHIPPLSNAREM